MSKLIESYADLSKEQKAELLAYVKERVPKGEARFCIYTLHSPWKIYRHCEKISEFSEADLEYLNNEIKDWVGRQSGYEEYGLHAELRNEVMDSGIIFNPKIYRSFITWNILTHRGVPQVDKKVSAIMKNTLRIMKMKHNASNSKVCYAVKHVCQNSDQLASFVNNLLDTNFIRASEVFKVLGEVPNYFPLSLQRLNKPLRDACKLMTSRTRGTRWRAARESYQLLLEDIAAYGKLSALLYLADLGERYMLSIEIMLDFRAAAEDLLSCDDDRIDAAMERADDLLKMAASCYIHNKKAAKAAGQTSVFG